MLSTIEGSGHFVFSSLGSAASVLSTRKFTGTGNVIASPRKMTLFTSVLIARKNYYTTLDINNNFAILYK